MVTTRERSWTALAEALAAAVAVRGGKKVLSHLESVQQQLVSQGAYWEKPQKTGQAGGGTAANGNKKE